MKKRIACVLLTLVMLLSLVPAAAITASAAPDRHVSEAGIKVIKNYIGFHKTAYEVSTGVYRIGYGTAAVKGQTITEANADLLLREQLANVDVTINAVMAGAPDTALVQKRFDALVWYTYVEGSGWTGNATFVNAVKDPATSVSALADAFCSWNYDVSGYPDDNTSRYVLNRRMAMLNLFVNGVYSSAETGSFAYTVFDAGEGAAFPNGARKMVQVFSANSMTTINVPNPVSGSSKFLGWYDGTALVTGVGSATAGSTLTARWQASDDKVGCNYTLPAYVIYTAAGIGANDTAIIRNSPSSTAAQIDVLKRDATVTIVAETIVGAEKWVELSTGGWVKLSNAGAVLPTIFSGTTITVTDDIVNIREKPNVTAARVGTAKRGDRLTIYMIEGDWGYCAQGWVCLTYTSYNQNSGSSAYMGEGTPAKVVGAENVNVRTAPGVDKPLATRLPEGTTIKVYEETTVNGGTWGHIDQGWIFMAYVKLTPETTSTAPAGSTATTGSTVYVNSGVTLNVRSGPGTGYKKIGTLNAGAPVVILQKQVADGVTWGLTDAGWINLNYVTTQAPASQGTTASGIGGTIVNCSVGANIRAAAGTANALVGVAPVGSRVNVTERVQVNGFYWGHIDRGWVCMDYVQLDKQWVDQNPVTSNQPIDSVVSSSVGYPAKTVGAVELRESASSHAKSLMTLNNNATVYILERVIVGTKQFGKVTVGSSTGWVDIDSVALQPVNAKVTAAKADAYELPSTRSKFYASLTQGTYITIGEGGNGDWQISDGLLWGKITLSGHSAWIKMNDVSMFTGNIMPTGKTTLNGAGYLTGTIGADAVIYYDENGSVSSTPTNYTLVPGHRVNILARNYNPSTGATWAKVSVGAVTGWFQITSGNLTLDHVTVQAKSEVKAVTSAPASANAIYSSSLTFPAGTRMTIVSRMIVPDGNEINNGIMDVGMVYVGDNHDAYYYVALDDGKLSYVSAASNTNTSAPSIVSSVVITGKAPSGLNIYEETNAASAVLLKLNTDSNVTVLNWKNVGGITWGKVQIGNIVGWVKVSDLSFTHLRGAVAVAELRVYNTADKSSSVQILRVNDQQFAFLSAPVFDGSIVWAQISVADKTGWVDMADLRLSDSTAVSTPELVLATGKINSVNATINVTDSYGNPGEVMTLPKTTAVNLTDVKMSSGKAMWKVDLGDKSGWVDMDFVNLNSAIARVTEASARIYDDLVAADAEDATKVLYTLYNGETATVQSFMVYSGKLYGEVAYANTTGWILICTDSVKHVALTPGSTGTTLGSDTNTATGSAAPSSPTTPTTSTEPASSVPAYIVCSNTVNVRSGGGMEYPVVTTLNNGTNVRIYEQTTVLGKGWAHIDQGWVCMDYVQLGTAGTAPTTGGTGAGNVTIYTSVPSGAIAIGYANQDVKIRSGSGLGYPEVATVKKGSGLVIYEKKLDGGMSWGRTDNGWVCISYLTINGIGASGTGSAGTVATGNTANVRSNASSGSALMAKVVASSRVMVHETMTVGNETWGRTDLGWINMQYILLDSVVEQANASLNAAATNTTSTDTTISDSGIPEVG